MITNHVSTSKASPPPLLKMREVAKVLSLSRQSVKALVEGGDLEGRPLTPSKRKMKRVHVRVTHESLSKFYKKRFGRELDANLQPQPNR